MKNKTFHKDDLFYFIRLSTLILDETPPAMIENTITEKTATTVKLHLTTTEPLNKLKIRYRIVGTADWTEEAFDSIPATYDINLTGLTAGQLYEYQCILEDNTGNQLVTEWERV